VEEVGILLSSPFYQHHHHKKAIDHDALRNRLILKPIFPATSATLASHHITTHALAITPSLIDLRERQ
jgi:hypothetical protein